MSVTYCLPNEATTQFNWVSWDSEAVLYNRLSGDTHRVMAPAGHVLKLIASDTCENFFSADTLLKSLPDDFSTTLDQVEALLAALCLIGILKSSPIEDCRPHSCGTISSASC